jgi:hypothetical protein
MTKSPVSSVVLVCGNFCTRHQAKDIAVDTIDLALRENIPTAWVPNPTDERYRKPNSVDVLKQLVLQTLKHNRTMLDDHSSALSTLKFQTTTTEGEWLDILDSVLLGLDQ